MKIRYRALDITLLLSLSLLVVRSSRAEVTLPAVWSNHAIVQRSIPTHIWGKASPEEIVTVAFRGFSASTKADSLGRWNLDLPPGDAGGPFTMEVRGTNTIILSDVLVGDVWLASGQSNMEFHTKEVIGADDELKKAQHPNIRLLPIGKRSSDYPQDDALTTGWLRCSPETVAEFSAVAYFFGRAVEKDQHVPIGLIEADWGGTPAETWTSLKALSSNGALAPAWSTWAEMSEGESTTILEQSREERERKAALAAGRAEPEFPWHPQFRSWLPGGAFNGMIAPLVRLPLRGVIWYQGESNAEPGRDSYYEALFTTLIEDWRRRWAQGNFPFLYVQLANYGSSPQSKWPELREAQRRTLKVSETAMVVAIDIGDADNIHPKNKQEVGRRLALAARAVSYHEQLEFSGPMYRTQMRERSSIRLYFDHAASGLVAKGGLLSGFEVAGEDGKFVVAQGRIEGETVLVSSSLVKEPISARYGWAGNPQCTLYNREGLPASPFTTQ